MVEIAGVVGELVGEVVEEGAPLGHEARLRFGFDAEAVDARQRGGREGEDRDEDRAGDDELEEGEGVSAGRVHGSLPGLVKMAKKELSASALTDVPYQTRSVTA